VESKAGFRNQTVLMVAGATGGVKGKPTKYIESPAPDKLEDIKMGKRLGVEIRKGKGRRGAKHAGRS